MKTTRMLSAWVAALVLGAGGLRAQEKHPTIPVKLTVVFSEYDGSKKISSLPYVIQLSAGEHGNSGSLRMGLRVPVRQGHETRGEPAQIAEVTEYQDVGTSIDCNVTPQEDQYAVWLSAERSSVYEPRAQEKPAGLAGNSAPNVYVISRSSGDKPIFSAFRTREQWLMRDDQTVEAIAATDPITGRVTKMDVTLNVSK